MEIFALVWASLARGCSVLRTSTGSKWQRLNAPRPDGGGKADDFAVTLTLSSLQSEPPSSVGPGFKGRR